METPLKGKSGIYTITNIINGKVYIGSATSFSRRWAEHRRTLRKGIHYNPYLQRTWNKYGEDSFEFKVLEYSDKLKELYLVEQFWINLYRERGKKLYNVGTPGPAFMVGRKHTKESKQRMSKARKGKPSPIKGSKLSKETRCKMSESAKGRPKSKEHCHNLSKALMGHHISKETRSKISRSVKANWAKRRGKLLNSPQSTN